MDTVRIILATLAVTLTGVMGATPVRAQTICRCECFPVPGGRVCRRHCYETEPFAFAEPEHEASEPEAEEEEPQHHDEYATEDETPDVTPDLQVEPVSRRSFRPQRRQYAAPYEPTAASFANSLDPAMQALICPLFFGGLAFLFIVGVFRLVSHFESIDKARRDIKAVERHTKSARQIEQRLSAAAREADAFIESYRADQYRKGHDA